MVDGFASRNTNRRMLELVPTVFSVLTSQWAPDVEASVLYRKSRLVCGTSELVYDQKVWIVLTEHIEAVRFRCETPGASRAEEIGRFAFFVTRRKKRILWKQLKEVSCSKIYEKPGMHF